MNSVTALMTLHNTEGLFNIEEDPCERIDLSSKLPGVVARLASRIDAEYNASAVPCLNDPGSNPDAMWWPAAHPDNFDGVWSVWEQ
jgi:hypothetical protein